jgi:hypothetical protein
MRGRFTPRIRKLALAGVVALALLAGGIGQTMIPGAFGHAPAAHADVDVCWGC